MPESTPGLAVLGAMLTPAVLISACGLLILSTSARLTRVVDRVRGMIGQLEALLGRPENELARMRHQHLERQLGLLTRRGRLIQRALTSLYLSLGIFVATILAIALTTFVPALSWGPTLLGLGGTLILFYGCLQLIRETGLALKSIDGEMAFVLELREAYRSRAGGPAA
jgi:hypothetical protein